MEIKRNMAIDGSFSPEAANFLGGIPPYALHSRAYGLRHPESTYSFSLDKLAENFIKVIDCYKSKTAEYTGKRPATMDLQQLVDGQESLLRALRDHLDDCYLILKALVNPTSIKRETKFAEELVLDSRLPGAKSFQQSTADYKHALRIVNRLKHQQGRLRGLAVWANDGPHLGYFLEEPDLEGRLGPSPDMHPDQGCISFGRDIPWHMFNVYRCSMKLAKAVCSAVEGIHGVTLRPARAKPIEKWTKAVRLACDIPPAIFPKEVSRKVARFRLSDGDRVLAIKFPEAVRVAFPAHLQVTCSTMVDGNSPVFKVPFP